MKKLEILKHSGLTVRGTDWNVTTELWETSRGQNVLYRIQSNDFRTFLYDNRGFRAVSSGIPLRMLPKTVQKFVVELDKSTTV